MVGEGDLDDIDVEEYEIGEVIEDYEVEDADHEEIVAVQIKSESNDGTYVVQQSSEDGDMKHVDMEGNKFTCLLCPSEGETKPFSCESKDLGFMTLHLKIDHDVSFDCKIFFREIAKHNCNVSNDFRLAFTSVISVVQNSEKEMIYLRIWTITWLKRKEISSAKFVIEYLVI